MTRKVAAFLLALSAAKSDALDTKLESVLTADQKTKFAAFRAASAAAGPDGPPHPSMGTRRMP